MFKLMSAMALFAVLLCMVLTSQVSAQFSTTDYLIADSTGDRIAVYDQNLAFLRYLDTAFPGVTGLTLVSPGFVAAVGPGRIKIYSSAGTVILDFTDPRIGTAPRDIKAYLGNRLFVGTRDTTNSVAEFTTTGTYVRSLGAKAYTGVAVLSGLGQVWASLDTGNTVDVYSITTGMLTSTITLDSGQGEVGSMYFNPATSTVLLTDFTASTVYERSSSGTLVRAYMGATPGLGVTVGPSGTVAATQFTVVHRWDSTGTFLGTVDISANVTNAINIIWAGALGPSAAAVSVSGRVLNAEGRGLAQATVSLTDSAGVVRTAITNPFGYFQIGDVEAGQSYLVEVRHKILRFAPQFLNVNDNVADLVFSPTDAGASKLYKKDSAPLRRVKPR